MNRTLAVTRLHLVKRFLTFGVPLLILAFSVLISVAIAVIAARGGVDTASEMWSSGARNNNTAALSSIVGFLVYLGVQAVATTFPYALAMGTSRREFTVGTLLWSVIVAAVMAVATGIGLWLELATGHWGVNAYMFDSGVLGLGNYGTAMATMFLATLGSLSVGGMFGAVWVRFGARGPVLVAVLLAVIIVALLLICAPYFGEIFAAIERWHIAVAAIIAILIAAAVQVTMLRRATVR